MRLHWPVTDEVMSETDRRSWAEARLFTLYERCFADLQGDIRRLDPGHSPGSTNSIWPKKLTWEEFQDCLRRSVRNSQIRRWWVERLVLLATPQERAALQNALDPALLDSQDRTHSNVEDENVGTSAARGPHFLAKRQKEAFDDSG